MSTTRFTKKGLQPIAWRTTVDMGDGFVYRDTVQAVSMAEAMRVAEGNYLSNFGHGAEFVRGNTRAEVKYAKDRRRLERE